MKYYFTKLYIVFIVYYSTLYLHTESIVITFLTENAFSSSSSLSSITTPSTTTTATAITFSMACFTPTSSSIATLKNHVLELLCPAQSYEWGKIGSNSLAGQLATANNGTAMVETKPYAEFWMGTHTNGPSQVKGMGLRLDEVLGQPLPFLLKILSVEKALSIQAHPDSQRAKILHAKDPLHYPDDQHKPEMAIALTPFEALCGFLPLCHIIWHIERINSWFLLIGPDTLNRLTQCHIEYSQLAGLGENFCGQYPESGNEAYTAAKAEIDLRVRALLSSIVRKILNLEPENAKKVLDDINNELTRRKDIKPWKSVFFRLYHDFPNDAGALFVFLLNHFTMDPGQSIFLAANEPHAYLSGDCVEVMAASDNVVRAGLTPKFKDVATLIDMLTFNCSAKEQFAVEPTYTDECHVSMLYAPKAISDFAVIRSDMPPNDYVEQPYALASLSSVSLLVCTKGQGRLSLVTAHSDPYPTNDTIVSSMADPPKSSPCIPMPTNNVSMYPGQVVYIPSYATTHFYAMPDSNVVLYRAFQPS